MNNIELIVVTPKGEILHEKCESIRLWTIDDEQGRGGGSLGIRRGHAPAIAALSRGAVAGIREDGSTVQAEISGGIAMIGNDCVTVLADDEAAQDKE